MFAPDGRPRIDRKMLTAKAEALDRTIRKLTDMRDGLRHAAAAARRATWSVRPSAASCARQLPERWDPEGDRA